MSAVSVVLNLRKRFRKPIWRTALDFEIDAEALPDHRRDGYRLVMSYFPPLSAE